MTGKGRQLLRMLADVTSARPSVDDALLYGTADGRDDGRWHPRPLPAATSSSASTTTASGDDVDSPIENVNTVKASGAAQTLPDVIFYTMHNILLTADCALTFPVPSKGKSLSLRLVQDGTGSRIPTWDSAVDWGGGTAPTISTGAGKVDLFGFACFTDGIWDNLGYRLDSR